MFCSKCGTEVPENVNFCAKCGNATAKTQDTAVETEEAATQTSGDGLDGVSAIQAERSMRILMGEVFIISIIAGIYYKSWLAFGGVFGGGILLLLVKALAIVFCIILALCWGFIGYIIGSIFSSNASTTLGIIGLVLGAGTHYLAYKGINSVKKE